MFSNKKIRLTSYSPCAGCASKMGPEALAQVLRPLAGMFDPTQHPQLLRGLAEPDDALVWRLDDERALVQTADFFPPVVDDAYAFGAIAAANAISDIYAMGGEPIYAINLVGFPEDLDPAVLADILRGGAEKVREAGAVIAGGHTTTDLEPRYGLAVTGLVHPERILSKGGARPGDVLILTKPLGTGIITTAANKQKCDDEDLETAIASMTRLSKGAAAHIRAAWPAIHALTDITGYGLVGHGHEMAQLSGLTLRFALADLPILPGAREYAERGFVSGGGERNLSYYEPFLDDRRGMTKWERHVVVDPQTSGGLLAAVAPDAVDALLATFHAAGEPVWRVGEAIAGRPGGIEIA